MKPCRRVGLDVTWRCNWSCLHCFYRWDDRLHTAQDVPLETLLQKVDTARAGGLNHVVLEGWGEPTLYPKLGELLCAVRDRGMTSSIITNGVQPTKLYDKCYREWGLDHLHISSHGFGHTLDTVADRKDAGVKQRRTKEWLKAEGLPFRTNVTLQQANYKEIPEIIAEDMELGSFHCVMLGFLPHYEWHDLKKTHELAVHPAELRPYIERASKMLLEADHYFTIRYHPFCHLDPKYWPYVVNARYVLFDPWEWNYSLQANDQKALWGEAQKLGDSVACSEPCNKCTARRHCGGWNRVYQASYEGAGLQAITGVPAEYLPFWERDGGIHDLNPINHLDGVIPLPMMARV